MILISLYDQVACTWSTPACTENEFTAERDFYSACRNKNSLIGQHPEDFCLYVVGYWYPTLVPEARPRLDTIPEFKCICRGVNFVDDEQVKKEQDKHA